MLFFVLLLDTGRLNHLKSQSSAPDSECFSSSGSSLGYPARSLRPSAEAARTSSPSRLALFQR